MQQTTLSLPDFPSIRIGEVNAELDQLLASARQTISQLEILVQPTWNNFAQMIQGIDMALEDFFSPVGHLNGVMNSDELRKQYQQAIAKLTAFDSECGQNKAMFKQYQALAESDEAKMFDAAKTCWLKQAIKGFTLSGIDLPVVKQERYKAIKTRMAELSQSFSNNVLDATEAFSWHVQVESALAGIPKALISQFAEKAKVAGKEGYLLGLDMPTYQAVATYADNRLLRETFYFAYQCKASDQGRYTMDEELKFDNSDTMVEILQLRQEMACLLGFDSYSDYSLERKMAKDVNEVIDFLLSLSDSAQSFAKKELAVLAEFAKKSLNINELKAWDVAYVSEKYRQSYYALNDEELRAYFPLLKVVEGLFAITSELFDIDVEKQQSEGLYHEDVELYYIKKGGKVIAAFYFDVFARDKKRGGAWMADCRSRWQKTSEQLQLPVAFLTCNFRPASEGKPALLSHGEVTTLFHEFGHGLHHMLTSQTIAGISGIAGVEWDAVELPSQFLENWCWQKASIQKMSAHYETGNALPEALLNAMLSAKNFNAGLTMVRQLEFSLFDMLLHCVKTIDNADQVQDLLDQVRDKVAAIESPLDVRFQHGFSHIFAGGYAAGYYSYKWAEVLSADGFGLFEENGLFDKSTGKKFLTEILQMGSGRPAAESFAAFRGREPSVSALLRHNGLSAD